MGYSTLEDLRGLLPESALIQLSNDQAGATEVDATTVEAAIATADSIIDGYVERPGCPVPLDPVPGLVRTLSANIAVFHLYRRRSTVPEIWQNQYKADMAVLVKISTGQINIGAVPGAAQKETPAQALTHSAPQRMGGRTGLLNTY